MVSLGIWWVLVQPSEWEKRIANKITDWGLISRIYKQLTQLYTRKTKTQSKTGQKKKTTKTGQKTQRDIFPKKTYRCIINPWKDVLHCSLFSSVQSLSHVQFFVTPWIAAWEKCKSKMGYQNPSSKNLQTVNAGEQVQKRKPSCTDGGMQIDTTTMEKLKPGT